LFVLLIFILNVPLPIYTNYKIKSSITKYNQSQYSNCQLLYLYGSSNDPVSVVNGIAISCKNTEDKITIKTVYNYKKIKIDELTSYRNKNGLCGSRYCFRYSNLKKDKNKIICFKGRKTMIYN
jgi:hypothetical protein